jgi:subtilase family serine protease
MNRVLVKVSFALIAACAVALSGCGGGGHAAIPATAGNSSKGTAPSFVAGGIPYGASAASGAVYLGRAQLASVGLDVHVALANETGLYQYAREANDPASSLYRAWLTPQQLGSRFGAAQNDYAALTNAFLANGITVKTYPQRTMLRIRGPQAAVEKMLGITIGMYRKGTQRFISPTNSPRPPQFASKIVALTGAVGYSAWGRDYVRASNVYANGYAPQQIASAFDYDGAYAAGYTGKGIHVGIIGTGPITDGDPRFACGNAAGCGDVADFKTLYHVPGSGTVSQVFATDANLSTISGESSPGLASPPPVTAYNAACVAQGGTYPTDFTTCNPEDGEAQLDTEQIASLAYDANVLFYIAYNPNEGNCADCAPGQSGAVLGINLTDDEIQQAIADDTADILSMSFGLDENDSESTYFPNGTRGPGPTEFAMAAAEGMAVFASSGDTGAEGCYFGSGAPTAQLCVSYPATDPNVVSVGGVNAPIDQSGQLSGPVTVWGVESGSQASHIAAGGGCSAYFPLLTAENGIAGETCTKRSQPDVSLDADTNTGVSVDIDAPPGLGGRVLTPIGGTSVSAPEMAAMWALVLQACKQNPASCGSGTGATPYRLGNPNPLFYKIYASGSHGLGYANVFYDVQYGNNSIVPTPSPVPTTSTGPVPSPSPTPVDGYNAGVGYDLSTGLGVPYGRNLIKAIVGV